MALYACHRDIAPSAEGSSCSVVLGEGRDRSDAVRTASEASGDNEVDETWMEHMSAIVVDCAGCHRRRKQGHPLATERPTPSLRQGNIATRDSQIDTEWASAQRTTRWTVSL